MIVDNKILIRWHVNNRKHYENLGYIFTKYNNFFEINVKHISKGSHIKIKCKCDECHKEKYVVFKDYYLFTNELTEKYYCKDCCKIKRDNTILEKYNTTNVSKLDFIKEKKIQTSLNNYNVEYPAQCEIVKEKMKKTNLKRRNVEYALQDKEVIYKREQTCLKNNGCKYPLQNINILNKAIETCIKNKGEAFFHIVPNFNIKSIDIFNEISKHFNVNIQHALNGGEKKFERYFVDGYIESHNIIIEYDEKYHKNKISKDLERQKYIENKYKCTFIRINEDLWHETKNDIYKLLAKLITKR
jgi:hypothetical protein